jgi:hypothetical protein
MATIVDQNWKPGQIFPTSGVVSVTEGINHAFSSVLAR